MTATQVARAHQRRQRVIQQESRITLNALGASMVEYCRFLLEQTVYAIPEDVSATGRKKWVRTGKLKAGEKYILPTDYSVAVVNSVPYAEPRHEAGKPGRRSINPRRIAHWRNELIATFRPIFLQEARAVMRRVWGRGIGT